MFSYCTRTISLDIKTTGTVRKPNIRVCQVNTSINYPSLRTISGEMFTAQVGILGN